jgi:glycosyltransferase involved in cell wall biosynthesis
MGSFPHDKLEKWFQKSTFFILGSHKEGGSISLIEAMACGCIPIVTNIPAFITMTNKAECGFLFDPGNSDQLTQILYELKDLNLDEMKEKVLLRFEKEMSHQSIVLKIKNAIQIS